MKLRLGMFFPQEAEFVDRLGGIPWGLPQNRWPICPDCNRPYALLLQLQHQSGGLDLGRQGRRLYAFQCAHWPENCYSVLDNGSAIILEPEDFTGVRSTPPIPMTKWFLSMRVIEWHTADDLLSLEMNEKLLTDVDTYWDLPKDLSESICLQEKVGGAPARGNYGPISSAGDNWNLLVQITDQPEAEGPIPTPNQIGGRVIDNTGPTSNDTPPPQEYPTVEQSESAAWLSIHKRNGDNSRYSVLLGNFGQGYGYILGRSLKSTKPEARFTWQRW